MKNIKKLAAMCSFAAMFAVSCVKENSVDIDNNASAPGFRTVVLNAGVDTKISSAGDILKWNSSAENLAVFGQIGDVIQNYKFTKPKTDAASESANFTGEVHEEAELKYAVYPYHADRVSYSTDKVLTMYLDNTLTCNATNSVPNTTPLYGMISDDTSIMKSACAYLKVTLPGTSAIYDNVTVDAEKCSGSYSINLSGNEPVFTAGNKDQIKCSPKSNRSGAMYIPIIPGTYDNIKITVNYVNGYPAFVKESASSQTFECGKYYDCKELGGAYVESVTTGACTLEGTTLSMEASAVVWKYSGVTNANYTAKFFYSEEGTEKGAAGWTEVAAAVTGETNDVTLTAAAEVAAGKNYQFYAQISDGVNTYDGEIETAKAKKIVAVEWNFAQIVAATNSNGEGYTPFTYVNSEAGYLRIVNDEGNPVFPTFTPGTGKANCKYQIWDGEKFGDTQTFVNATPAKMLGGKTTCIVDGVTYELALTKSTKYYTVSSGKLCATNGFNMTMSCPENAKIVKVKLQTNKSDTFKWGVGSSGSGADLIETYEYNPNKITDKENSEYYEPIYAELTLPSPKQGKPYYMINGNNNSRLMILTVYYEY